ncbi:MAG: hypothetical protein ACOCMW_05120 [Campylobacter hyointestinalis]
MRINRKFIYFCRVIVLALSVSIGFNILLFIENKELKDAKNLYKDMVKDYVGGQEIESIENAVFDYILESKQEKYGE